MLTMYFCGVSALQGSRSKRIYMSKYLVFTYTSILTIFLRQYFFSLFLVTILKLVQNPLFLYMLCYKIKIATLYCSHLDSNVGVLFIDGASR